MKLIGFIKEHHSNIGKLYDHYLENESHLKSDQRLKLINYFDQGITFFGWMHYLYHIGTDNVFLPDSFMTDGEFIWPAYLSYYLRNDAKFNLSADIYDGIISNSYSFDKSNFDETATVNWFLEKVN